jgi:hypothetical protein
MTPAHCYECGQTPCADPVACAASIRREIEMDREAALRKTGRPCSMCGADPCESPSGCRSQARYEAECGI